MAQDVEDAVGGGPADDELLVARALRVVEPCTQSKPTLESTGLKQIKMKNTTEVTWVN